MEITVYRFVRTADEVVAVRYSGDKAQAHLLIKAGWLEGADNGFGRNNEGSHILRGLIGEKVVYPGDIIVFHPDWTLDVYEADVFMNRYEDQQEVVVLTDGKEDPSPVDLLQQIPTGNNEGAVQLETIPGTPEREEANQVVEDEAERAEHGDTTTPDQQPEHVQAGSQPITEESNAAEDPNLGIQNAAHLDDDDLDDDDDEDDDDDDDE